MIGHISANQRFKYTKYKNHYLTQKQYPLYLLLVSARLIKYRVKTKHMSIRTSKNKAYCKIQIANNKLIKNQDLVSCYFNLFYCLLDLSCGECDVIYFYFMCCSVNVSVCLVCCVFVNCLVKQFTICLGMVVILLLNVMEVFSGGGGGLLYR